MRQLVHDIGMRLKAYAICHQIRRVKDGFVNYDDMNCLSFNQLEYKQLYDSTQSVTQLARSYVSKYDKTILVNHSREYEQDVITGMSK